MDQKFFVEYLIEEKDDLLDATKENLEKYIQEENYKELEETLKEYLRNKKGYDIDQINFPERYLCQRTLNKDDKLLTNTGQTMEEVKESLVGKLKATNIEDLKNLKVVLMPDFFLDHFALVKDIDFLSDIRRVYKEGGGNLLEVPQVLTLGGCAARTSLALARLCVKTSFIGRTSKLGYTLLNFLLQDANADVDITKVRTDGVLGKTITFEFEEGGVNVMINEIGTNKNFGFSDLNEEDLKLIAKSDLVCVLDWSVNIDKGTELAEEVFKYAKRKGLTTYFDTADLAPRINELKTLFDKILCNNNLDILSINEKELRILSGMNFDYREKERVLLAANRLKVKVKPEINIHTSDFVATAGAENTVVVPTFNVTPCKFTGAGDVWNAGNILGLLLKFTNEERLLLGNAMAGYYISHPDKLPPTIMELLPFIRETDLKK